MGAAGVKGEEAQISSWDAKYSTGDMVSSIVITVYSSHVQGHVGTRLIGGTP